MAAVSIPFHRRSIRLKEFDYTSPGVYFVTMVTCKRACLFGEVVEGEMRLNHFGQIVTQAWEWLPTQYTYVNIDSYIVMPNHFHAILQIIDINDYCRGGSRPALTQSNKTKPLGQLIGVFKTISAKQINLSRDTPGHPIWHRNYYEHIVRNRSELESFADYILINPGTWSADPENILYPQRNLP
jgi:REP element-mobilizing transposase RayT